jgi:hypothetical protein
MSEYMVPYIKAPSKNDESLFRNNKPNWSVRDRFNMINVKKKLK